MISADLRHTLVFYIPPHDLLAVLQDMVQILGAERKCVVARELTKVLHLLHLSSHLLCQERPELCLRTALKVMTCRCMKSLSGALCNRLSANTLRHLQRYTAVSSCADSE